MKAKELIKLLEQVPPNVEVYFSFQEEFPYIQSLEKLVDESGKITGVYLNLTN